MQKKNHLYLIALIYLLTILYLFIPEAIAILSIIDDQVIRILFMLAILFILIILCYGAIFLAYVTAIATRYIFAPFLTQKNNGFRPALSSTTPDPVKIAVLYPTCNDFSPNSVNSILSQVDVTVSLYICDDSYDANSIGEIDDFMASNICNENVKLLRRADTNGYKAGNLNNAIEVVDEPYTLIVDADQIIPADYLYMMLQHLKGAPQNISYVQSSHQGHQYNRNLFQEKFSYTIQLFWSVILPIRETYGFGMFYGHGGLFRTSHLKLVRFPHIVAEDLGISMELREKNLYGLFASDIVAEEEFPPSVNIMRKRHMKWVRGTCEFIFYHLSFKSFSKLRTVEKLDVIFSLTSTFLAVPILLVILISNIMELLFVPPPHNAFCFEQNPLDCFSQVTSILVILFSISPFLMLGIKYLLNPIKFINSYLSGLALYVATLPMTVIISVAYIFDRRAEFLVSGDNSSSAKTSGLFSDPNCNALISGEILIGSTVLGLGLHNNSLSVIGLGINFLFYTSVLRVFPYGKIINMLTYVGPSLVILPMLLKLFSMISSV